MADARAASHVSHLRRLWLYALCSLTLIFLLGPSVIVMPMSFSSSRYLAFPPPEWSVRWYRAYFESVEWRDATLISFEAAVLTMIVATIMGTAAAYALRLVGGRAARILQVVFALPLMIPVILIAVGIFLFFARIGLNNSVPGLVLAHSALAIPLVVISVGAALRSYDLNQEMVARSLGASRFTAFLTVTLPQIRFAVASGALLAFITSLDEVVIALFIAGGDSATLTRRMFTALRDEIDPTIAAISTLLIVLSVILLGSSQLLQRKR
jgi:putative spermidine/putrescine transport system permease protein